jgi:hypothetical protein
MQRMSALAFFGGNMRIYKFISALILIGASPNLEAFAQVIQQPHSTPHHQISPTSFVLTATATAVVKRGEAWGAEYAHTVVNYSLQNQSGMNLFMGIDGKSLSIGNCRELDEVRGALGMLDNVGVRNPGPAWGLAGSTQNRPVMMPSGAVMSGALIFKDCAAPNPGFPTAILSFRIGIGPTTQQSEMIALPIGADVPVRQIKQ